jgi:hypothetical protein
MGEEAQLRPRVSRWRRLYGASRLHLVGHALAFGASGYALLRVLERGPVDNFVIWFVGAALVHDLVLLPVYSALDLGARLGLHAPHKRARVPAINHLRVPALISGLLFLVYFPLILVEANGNYRRATGHPVHGYARNWLLITAALFAASAITYLGRSIRARRRYDR